MDQIRLGVIWPMSGRIWFADLRMNRLDPTDPLLGGPLEQAALHGVLERIRDRKRTLIAVRQVGEDTATNAYIETETRERIHHNESA